MMPHKVLHVLAAIKQELLSSASTPPSTSKEKPTKRPRLSACAKMRHARNKNGSWQNYMRTGGW
jgi:hypothetical protein